MPSNPVATLNPIQQGLKPEGVASRRSRSSQVATLNPIQQGLKHEDLLMSNVTTLAVATLNPIQQGLKPDRHDSNLYARAALQR